MIAGDSAGVFQSGAGTNSEDFLAQGDQVVRESCRFQRGVETADEPGIVSGHACRAVTGVAPLRLDAADGEHGFSPDMDEIASECEG